LIQRNPSRPGISHLFCQRQNRFLLSRLTKSQMAKEACRGLPRRKASNPERELIRLRFSSPRLQADALKAGRLKTRQEVLQDPPTRPASAQSQSQAAERPESPLTTQIPIHNAKQHRMTAQRPVTPEFRKFQNE